VRNSYLLKGYGIPDFSTLTKLLGSETVSKRRDSTVALPVDVPYLTSMTNACDQLLLFDPILFTTFVKNELKRWNKISANNRSPSFQRESEIAGYVARNARHLFARFCRNGLTLNDLAKSTEVSLRQIPKSKLEKLSSFYQNFNSIDNYDMRSNLKDVPISFNCFHCKSTAKDIHHSTDSAIQRYSFKDPTFARVNSNRLIPIDDHRTAERHFIQFHSCQSSLPERCDVEISDAQFSELQLDKYTLSKRNTREKTSEKHLFILTCALCTESKNQRLSLSCCLSCAHDHQRFAHGSSDIFMESQKQIKAQFSDNETFQEFADIYLDIRCALCAALFDTRSKKIVHEVTVCLARQLTLSSHYGTPYSLLGQDDLHVKYQMNRAAKRREEHHFLSVQLQKLLTRITNDDAITSGKTKVSEDIQPPVNNDQDGNCKETELSSIFLESITGILKEGPSSQRLHSSDNGNDNDKYDDGDDDGYDDRDDDDDDDDDDRPEVGQLPSLPTNGSSLLDKDNETTLKHRGLPKGTTFRRYSSTVRKRKSNKQYVLLIR
jgi:hypothetical protein